MSRKTTIGWNPQRLEEHPVDLIGGATQYTELSSVLDYEFSFPPPTLYTPLLRLRTSGMVLFPNDRPLLRSVSSQNGEQTVQISSRSKTRQISLGFGGLGSLISGTIVERISASTGSLQQEVFEIEIVPSLNQPFGIYIGAAIIVIKITAVRVKGSKWRRWQRCYQGTPSAEMDVEVAKKNVAPGIDSSPDGVLRLCDDL